MTQNSTISYRYDPQAAAELHADHPPGTTPPEELERDYPGTYNAARPWAADPWIWLFWRLDRLEAQIKAVQRSK